MIKNSSFIKKVYLKPFLKGKLSVPGFYEEPLRVSSEKKLQNPCRLLD